METSSTYTFLHAMLEKGLILTQFMHSVEFEDCLNLLQEKALISTTERQALLELATQLNIDISRIDK